VQDEPRKPGAEDREESKKPGEGAAPEETSNVVSIIQQNTVVINDGFVPARDGTEEWI
jgi:hypothetical protein